MNDPSLVKITKRVIIKIAADIDLIDIELLQEVTKLRGSLILEAVQELVRWCHLHETADCRWTMGYRDMALNFATRDELSEEDSKIESEIMSRWEAVKFEKIAAAAA